MIWIQPWTRLPHSFVARSLIVMNKSEDLSPKLVILKTKWANSKEKSKKKSIILQTHSRPQIQRSKSLKINLICLGTILVTRCNSYKRKSSNLWPIMMLRLQILIKSSSMKRSKWMLTSRIVWMLLKQSMSKRLRFSLKRKNKWELKCKRKSMI